MFAIRGLSFDELNIAAAAAITAQQKEAQRGAAITEHCSAAISRMVTHGELEGLTPVARHDYIEQHQEDFLRKLVSKFKDLKTMRVAGPLVKGDVYRHEDKLRLVTGKDKHGHVLSRRVEIPDYPHNTSGESQRAGHD